MGVANVEACRDYELPGSGHQAFPAVRRNVPVVESQQDSLVLHPGAVLTARLRAPAVIKTECDLT